MAIKKKITQLNGVVTEYHRISVLKLEVNQQNVIRLESYLSEEGRKVEKDYAAGLYDDIEKEMMAFPYTAVEAFYLPYDGDMTISSAYEYIKRTQKYEGAEDI